MDNNIIFSILLILIGIFLGIITLVIINYIKGNSASKKAEKLLEKAKKEAEKIKKDFLLEAKEEEHKLKIEIAPKGAGSENMSKIFMLKPADGIEGAKEAILSAVEAAGPNPCPPMVVGVGCGGNFETSALLAKKALLRPVGSHSSLEHIKEMEIELLEKINKTGIGPQGLGGKTTALAVNIETFATHIACMPIAVNISCHVTRHAVCEI